MTMTKEKDIGTTIYKDTQNTKVGNTKVRDKGRDSNSDSFCASDIVRPTYKVSFDKIKEYRTYIDHFIREAEKKGVKGIEKVKEHNKQGENRENRENSGNAMEDNELSSLKSLMSPMEYAQVSEKVGRKFLRVFTNLFDVEELGLVDIIVYSKIYNECYLKYKNVNLNNIGAFRVRETEGINKNTSTNKNTNTNTNTNINKNRNRNDGLNVTKKLKKDLFVTLSDIQVPVEYKQYTEELNISNNTLKKSMRTLEKYGFIKIEEGRYHVKQVSIVKDCNTYEEDEIENLRRYVGRYVEEDVEDMVEDDDGIEW